MDASKIPSTPEIKLHFLDYWRIIRVRKTIILTVWLIVAITAILVSMKLDPIYMSTAKIAVDKNAPDVNPMSGRLIIPTFDPFYVGGEFEIIKSNTILDEVIEDLHLREAWGKRFNNGIPLKPEEAYQRLVRRMLSLDQIRNTPIIKIDVYSDSKTEAADIANKIADVYKASRIKEKTNNSAKGIAILKDKREVALQGVNLIKTNLNRLRKELEVTDLEQQLNGPIMTLDQSVLVRLIQEQGPIRMQYNDLHALLQELDKKSPKDLRTSIPPAYKDANLTESLRDWEKAKIEFETRSKELGPDNPEYKKLVERLHLAETLLDQNIEGIIQGLRYEEKSKEVALRLTEEYLSEMKSKDLVRAEKTMPYFDAKHELKQRLDFYDWLDLKIQTEEVDTQLPQEGSVRIFHKATPSLRPARPNIPLIVGLGVVVGLMLGIGMAFFIEYLDTSVKTIDDVERAVQAHVLGVIPQNVGRILEEGVESPHAEAYRVLRTNLLFSRKDSAWNTITIVSGGAGEGKSTTLFNLATIFAQSGDRVLIVDSDLRRPSLHKLLDVSNSIGLTSYLLGQNTLEEVIQTTPLPNLDLMPSGKLPSSSMGILSSPQMRELVQELKRRYDFVFFDSPPIMGVSDASILASSMDMTLQVIQYRRYPQQMTIRAKQMIEKVGGHLMGIVLNNISIGQDDNYYYYSGYYNEYENEKKKAKKEDKKSAQAKVEIKQKY